MSGRATGGASVPVSEDAHVSTLLSKNDDDLSELNMGADWLESYMSDPNVFDIDIGEGIFGKGFVNSKGSESLELNLTDAYSSDNDASQTSSASEVGGHLQANRTRNVDASIDGSAGNSIKGPTKAPTVSEDLSASAESPPPKPCEPKKTAHSEWHDASRDEELRKNMTAILTKFLLLGHQQGSCVPELMKKDSTAPVLVKKLEAGLYHTASSREEYCDVATVAARVKSLVQRQLLSRQRESDNRNAARSARSSLDGESDSANPLAFYGAAEAPAEVTVSQRKVMLVRLFKLFAVGGPWESRVPGPFKDLLPSFVGRLEAALHRSAQSQAEYLNEATLQMRLAQVAKQLIHKA